jgi:methionyl aminopeptidase
MRAGGFLGDVSSAIEVVGRAHKVGIVTRYCGHGVGRRLHEEPSVPNVGTPGTGIPLVPGLVIAIEPMFTLGRADTVEMKDGWTVKTRDGSLAAHFEHTVAMTPDGPEIMTLP